MPAVSLDKAMLRKVEGALSEGKYRYFQGGEAFQLPNVDLPPARQVNFLVDGFTDNGAVVVFYGKKLLITDELGNYLTADDLNDLNYLGQQLFDDNMFGKVELIPESCPLFY